MTRQIPAIKMENVFIKPMVILGPTSCIMDLEYEREEDMTKLALFDFDLTLVDRDSIFILWQKTMRTRPQARKNFLKGLVPASIRTARVGGRAFKNHTLDMLNYYGPQDLRDFVLEDLLPHHGFRKGMEEVWRLKDAGYHLVLASASAEDYLVYVKEALPFDAVLGTKTRGGKILGDNNKGPAKRRRIQAYLDENKIEVDYQASRAYTDDYVADKPMLEMVKNRFVINRRLAPRSCEILDWRNK